MKKNIRNLIIAASAAVILGGVVAAVMLIPESKEINESDNRSTVLFDKTNCIPEQITVKNSGGEFNLLAFDYSGQVPKDKTSIVITTDQYIEGYTDDGGEEIYVEYTMQEHEDLKLSKTLTDKMYSELKNMTALKTIDKSSSKYSEYGIDEPASTVSVTYSDDSSYTILLGNESPEGQGVYVKIEGDENVYLVDKTTVTSFYFEKLQMFDKSLGGDLDEITALTLSGTAYKNNIEIRPNKTTCYPNPYMMEQPEYAVCDYTKTDSIISAIKGCSATWVSAVEVTDDDIRKYGLDKPYKKVRIEDKEGGFVEIIAGSPDKDNKFYIMNTSGKIIYQSDSDEIPWYSADVESFYTDNVFSCTVNMTNTIGLTSGGKTETYKMERTRKLTEDYAENYVYKVMLGDKEVNYRHYTGFLSLLNGFVRTGEKPPSTEGCTEMFRAKLSYFDNDNVSDEIILYRDKADKYFVVLNGKIMCYVDSVYAKEVCDYIPELSKSDE